MEALVHRAAKLAAAAVVGVLKSSNENKRLVSITFDGSLWKSFPYLSGYGFIHKIIHRPDYMDPI